ncbi:SWIM-type domain-containing protein [Mycena sanguinolenta]|uniref:SWIM-type domain-containing protein n=1 Tax=Mycena sanguinolenta TaxID=230812 RepID=A0A8H7DBC9_9AGAR|nr:SWIM-type domain-containing protein [Mycena sanguinolenta]
MAADTRPHEPFPWPWRQPSILVTRAQEERRQAKSWLDADLGNENDTDDSDSDYVLSDSDASGSDASSSDSDEQISDSELAYIRANTHTGWASSSTDSLRKLDKEAELDRQIVDLIQAEKDAAAAYNPDEVVAVITQLYELLVTMGHWPEGSIRYAPHTDPPVNEQLALQLGYTPAAVSLMHRLPYPSPNINGWNDDAYYIFSDTQIADYTSEEHLKEGRRPYPYEYIDGCPDIDPWLLPMVLPKRYGWHVMLDTNLGVVRAYGDWVPSDTVEWRRYSDGAEDDDNWEETQKTEYRRAPLVPAVRYYSEFIYAYSSLSRLPVISASNSDPNEEPYQPSTYYSEVKEEQQALLALYRECGWPDEWRRAEFLAKWAAQKAEITRKRRAIREAQSKKGRK